MAMLRVTAVALIGAALGWGLIGCDDETADDISTPASRADQAYLNQREEQYKTEQSGGAPTSQPAFGLPTGPTVAPPPASPSPAPPPMGGTPPADGAAPSDSTPGVGG